MAHRATSASSPRSPRLQKICTKLRQELFWHSDLHLGSGWRLRVGGGSSDERVERVGDGEMGPALPQR